MYDYVLMLLILLINKRLLKALNMYQLPAMSNGVTHNHNIFC